MERHHLKVQGFQYIMKYLPDSPCDYKSPHPLPLTSCSMQQLADKVIYNDYELCISKIVTDDLSDALTLTTVQQATNQDHHLQKLISCIQKGALTNDHDLTEYCLLFHELTYFQGVILQGD